MSSENTAFVGCENPETKPDAMILRARLAPGLGGR